MHAATDVTGFALAGHSFEVASASGVTIEYDAASLPVLPDALELAEFGFLPEGMYSNLDYVSSHIAFSGSVKQNLRDLVCTPETSGGLLLFMPESDAAEFARSFGEECCAVIGHVCSKRDADVVFC